MAIKIPQSTMPKIVGDNGKPPKIPGPAKGVPYPREGYSTPTQKEADKQLDKMFPRKKPF